MKSGAFFMKTGTFSEKHWNWKAHENQKEHLKSEKHLKSENHMKIEKHMKSIPEKWKQLKSEKHMKKLQTHEKHMKVKSTTFHEKHMLFITSFRVIMDFTVDFICWFHYEFHYRFHRNGILSEIHNEILLILVKSCEMLWISWNLVNFSEILVDVIKFVKKPIMKYGGISLKFAVKSIMKSAVKFVVNPNKISIISNPPEVHHIWTEICWIS